MGKLGSESLPTLFNAMKMLMAELRFVLLTTRLRCSNGDFEVSMCQMW